MRIFIGSSSEAKDTMHKIASWLRGNRHTALCWTAREAFRAGHDVFAELVRISTTVDGALFVFGEDDKTWTRGNLVWATRDNVLLEFGMFVGSLGRDSVRRVVVGKPWTSTDLLGVVAICMPVSKDAEEDREPREVAHARKQVVEWAKGLSPVYLKGLGFNLAKQIARNQRTPVRDILLNNAKSFLKKGSLRRIRALCSDKGTHGEAYYGEQFAWATEKGRSLRRIFVRLHKKSFCKGFKKREVMGILSHLKQESSRVQIRWVYEDDPWLGGTYSSSLGFALFDRSWIAHWGMQTGTFYEHRKGRSDHGVGDVLKKSWNDIWHNAREFDCHLVASIRGCIARPVRSERRRN